ncbi:hypothetical protein RB195_023905 [Necator americanus]|uniref:Peptidase A1 domain-containing protein n=1 Tax=Necator americanus TaxID=51031 RepID=A0ABR1EL89_NECAM
MTQARKFKYDVIGVTETRRRHPLSAVYDTGEEVLLGTCDSRRVGGVGVFVKKNMAVNIDSFKQLTFTNEKMRFNISLHSSRRLRSNIKLRRRSSRSFLCGPGEVLQRRLYLLQSYN